MTVEMHTANTKIPCKPASFFRCVPKCKMQLTKTKNKTPKMQSEKAEQNAAKTQSKNAAKKQSKNADQKSRAKTQSKTQG